MSSDKISAHMLWEKCIGNNLFTRSEAAEAQIVRWPERPQFIPNAR